MTQLFRFRLDVALQQRVRQEQAAQLVVTRTVQRRNAVAMEAARLQEELRAAGRPAMGASTLFDGSGRMNQLLYLDRTAQRVHQHLTQLAQWDAEIRRVRDLLLHASARRKALERLRERRKHEYDLEDQRRMDHEADELITMRIARPAEPGMEAYESLIS